MSIRKVFINLIFYISNMTENKFQYIKSGIPKHKLKKMLERAKDEELNAVARGLKEPIPAIIVAVFDEGLDHLLLTRRSPTDFPWPSKYMLGIAGKVDESDGGNVLNTLYRELNEELLSGNISDNDIIAGTLSIFNYTHRQPMLVLVPYGTSQIPFSVSAFGVQVDNVLFNDMKIWYDRRELSEVNEIEFEVLLSWMKDLAKDEELAPPFKEILTNIIATGFGKYSTE